MSATVIAQAPQGSPLQQEPGSWIEAPCPICQGASQELVMSASGRFFGTRASASIRRCACGMVLTNPQPRGQTLAAFYGGDQYYTHAPPQGACEALRRVARRCQMRGPLMHLRRWAESHASIPRFARRNAPEHFPLDRGLRLLDFGCGDGQFSRQAMALGLFAVGLEPDPLARSAANAAGVPVVQTLEEADAAAAGAPFDRIILRHVLEHLTEPVQTLRELARRLSPRGRILIAVPNVDSLQAQVFKEHWLGYELPRHLWHFSRQSLVRLVERSGIEVVHVRSVEIPNYARISAAMARQVSGQSPAYQPGNLAALEADFRGTELVLVGHRGTTPG